MERVNFNCICELAEIMTMYVNDEENDDYSLISAYCKFDIAKDLIETLIRMGNPLGNIIELEEYEISYYDREFVVYLGKNGIACEKCYLDDTYYYGGGDISYVHDECSSALLKYIDSEYIYEFGIKDEDSCEPKCGLDCCGLCDCNDEDFEEQSTKVADNKAECEVKSDENGYSISVKCNLDADEAMKIIKDMEHRMEHMNDMFREMDYFRRLLKF